MMRSRLLGAVCACVITLVTVSANATLVGRDFDGNTATVEAYYDTDANLTWLVDANYAATSSYVAADSLGRMTWAEATTWAAGLDINGVTGWRLPDTLQPDASCDNQGAGFSYGKNCTGSDLGNLFYNVLGGVAGSSISTTHNANYDLFSNIQPGSYWTATDAPSSTRAWSFGLYDGSQGHLDKTSSRYAWAVQTGAVGIAVSSVPVPAAVWLLGSGMLGLIGMARRK